MSDRIEARVEGRRVGSLVRQRLRPDLDQWNLALVQRDRVWDNVRIRRLLDSLLAGYPIGSLLVCAVPQPGEGMDPLTREVVAVQPGGDQLLDGQQRIAAMVSLFTGQGGAGRYYLHMTMLRRRDEVAIRRRNRAAVTDYVGWRTDAQELEYRPLKDRARYVDLARFADWAGIDDDADTRVRSALDGLHAVHADTTADAEAILAAIAFLQEVDELHQPPPGIDDLRAEADRAARLLRAWLRPVPVERHVFDDKMDILQAFERVNLEGVTVAGDDVFFAAIKTAWSNADRGLHEVVERVPVINRIGALRVLGRLAAMSAGQGDMIPLGVERLNGEPGREIVDRLSRLVRPDSPAVERMAMVSARITGPQGPGYALRLVHKPLLDDVLGWAATSEWIRTEADVSDEVVHALTAYLLGATLHEYWPIFGETYARRSFLAAVNAGVDGRPFPTEQILALTKSKWRDLRQGRRNVPGASSLANRHPELYLCVAQRLPFNLPLRTPMNPAYPDARVEIEWDHIWPQKKSSNMRIRRQATEGSKSVWRAGNLWALDRPLNTSASDDWPSAKLQLLDDPQARRASLPDRWPPAEMAFLHPDDQVLIREAEAAVRGSRTDGGQEGVAYGAEVFARFVATRGERLRLTMMEHFPEITAFGEPDNDADERDVERPDATTLSAVLALPAPSRQRSRGIATPAHGTQAKAQALGLGEEFDTLLQAIAGAGLRVVDYHRGGDAKWAKVGLPDLGRQAKVLFWIVPEADGPALAVPHDLGAFQDLLGIEPATTRSLFGAERPRIMRGGAEEFVADRLARLLALRARKA